MAEIPAFLLALEDGFNAAMISNDVEQIGRFVADEWVLVTPEAGPVPRRRLLDAIRTGRLTHTTMTKEITHAGVAGDMAWATGRGRNTGTFEGAPIAAEENVTDVYHRVGGTWRCVLTHLTPVRP